MAYYLIGASGRLGRAIAEEYASSGIVSLDRAVYEDWSESRGEILVSRYFEKEIAEEGSVIFIASGLLDSRLSKEDLLKVNYGLPRNIIEGVKNSGIKIITFGTVMERLLNFDNPYVQSKVALSNYVENVGQGRGVTHIQLHTLYGIGKPSPFMFLGQILESLRYNRPFRMTSGLQLREYHHLTDDAKVIRYIEESIGSGVVNLSHGRPLGLKEIAESIFRAFGRNELLCVGALPEPSVENYEKTFEPIYLNSSALFRDDLPAIIEYMRDCYHE